MIAIGNTNITKAYLGSTELKNIAIGDELLLSSEPLPYLKFTALEDGTFKHNTDALEYSLDEGRTWVALPANTDTPIITTGNSILWRGTMSPGNKNQYFVATGRFNASGNPLSLKYNNDFVGAVCVNYQFYKLFQNCTTLVNAQDLIIPDNFGGKIRTCMEMFEGCTSLVTAPELPALTLTTNCYSSMFSGCTSLTTAPQLPATSLANDCYSRMFENCVNLTTAPALAVTSLASGCCQYMFSGCTSLTTAPDLPATTLANNCYLLMFNGCTSLTTAPALLPATTLATGCYQRMFQNCKELVTAPVLPALVLTQTCYYYMFSACSKLNYIKAMFTDASATNCLGAWVNGVSSSGTFVKNSQSTFNTRGISGIPNNWTIETADS